MLILLEVPLIGYLVAPETTAERVKRFSAWLSRDGAKIALGLAVLVGLGARRARRRRPAQQLSLRRRWPSRPCMPATVQPSRSARASASSAPAV